MSAITEEIKARLDIVTYVGQYAALKKAGRYYKACCPFHNEKTPSFTVNPDTQSWRCFGACAEGGDIFSFAMKMHGWSFGEALTELGRIAGVETQQLSPQQKQRSEQLDHLRGLLKETAEVFHRCLTQQSEGAAALRYAREKRGFTDETIQKFTVGYAPSGWQTVLDELRQLGFSEDHIVEVGVAIRNDQGRVYDRFRNRLIIPIRDERGRVIGFGARALDPDDTPKYLNSPQTPTFDKSRTLFGLDSAKRAVRDTGTAVIVEGYMDAVQAHQAGFLNVVAQMGTALTEAQLKLIAPRYAQKIILALDADAAGQNATMRSLEVARQTLQADYAGKLSVDIRILQIPGAKDPDDLIRENPDQWQKLVDAALPVADYVIDTETASLSPNATVQEREIVARRVLPLLIASENDLYKKDNLQKLALKLRIGERELLAWAADQQRAAAATPPPRRAEPTADDAPDMPPLDYDILEPPPFAEDDEEQVDFAAARRALQRRLSPAAEAVRKASELERHCLRMLLSQPDLWYTVNRKLRELAADDERLHTGFLGELCAADFQHTSYRTLLDGFCAAMRQDEYETLAYMRQHLEPVLVQSCDELLIEEEQRLSGAIHHRFAGDTAALWKHHERRVLPFINIGVELVEKTLRLRLLRVTRERQEMQFLQMEAQESGDFESVMAYTDQLMLLIRVQNLIEGELKRQIGNFV